MKVLVSSFLKLFLLIIVGLLKTENDEAKKMALTIARRYTVGAMFSCPDGSEVCNMFEKVFYIGRNVFIVSEITEIFHI